MSDDRVLAHKAPGLPCPECATPIVVDPLALLAAAPIACAACGLELHVNREESAETLAVLQDYMDEFAAIRQALSDRVAAPAKGARGPRRRPATRPARGRKRARGEET